MSTERTGKQWYTFLAENLPPYIQEQVRATDAEANVVRWVESTARWHVYAGPLPEDVSSAILGFVIRLRRDEPHLVFRNGHVFYYLDPESSYCQLDDLERNLEGQNRYAGGVPWTVGQHWRFCVELARLGYKRAGLTPDPKFLQALKYHDHAEGVVQDLTVGLKRALRSLWSSGKSEFDELEARAAAWVQARLPLPPVDAGQLKFVKGFDMRAAWIEAQMFNFPDYFVEEVEACQSIPVPLNPLLPGEIEAFKRIQAGGPGEAVTFSGPEMRALRIVLQDRNDSLGPTLWDALPESASAAEAYDFLRKLGLK